MARRVEPRFDRDVPSAFVQTARPAKRVRRRRDRARLAVNTVIALIVVALFANAVMMIGNYRTANELQASVSEGASPSFKSRYDVLGAQVVRSWLTGDQPVVDTVEGVEWPTVSGRGDTTGIDVVSVGYLGGRTVPLAGSENFHETLTYSVVAADGSQYVASFDMGVIMTPGATEGEPASARPVLLSAPLVEPRASVQVVQGAGMPAGEHYSIAEGSALLSQVRQWVTAFTVNSPEALKSLTGDTSSSQYLGLVSDEEWSPVEGSIAVLWAVGRPDGEHVVARVVWDMSTPELADDALGREDVAQPKRIRQSADLLIADADSGLPRIVAWGSPGAYETMEPLGNALVEEE